MENSKHGSRSLMNSKLNTKPLEKETYSKYNKQPKSILFKPSSYKKQSNPFF